MCAREALKSIYSFLGELLLPYFIVKTTKKSIKLESFFSFFKALL